MDACYEKADSNVHTARLVVCLSSSLRQADQCDGATSSEGFLDALSEGRNDDGNDDDDDASPIHLFFNHTGAL